MLQSLFYLTGILFFLIIIVAAFIFIRQTNRTARQITRILTSKEIEDLILQIRSSVESFSRRSTSNRVLFQD